MKKLNLLYKIKRFFQGESGGIEKTGPVQLYDENNRILGYDIDYYGNLPRQVTFRNPLGEEVTRLSQLTSEERIDFKDNKSYSIRFYKNYKVGDKFP